MVSQSLPDKDIFLQKELLDRFIQAGNYVVLATMFVQVLYKYPERFRQNEKEYSNNFHKLAETHNAKILHSLFQEIKSQIPVRDRGTERRETSEHNQTNRSLATGDTQKTNLLEKCIAEGNEQGYTFLAVAVNNLGR